MDMIGTAAARILPEITESPRTQRSLTSTKSTALTAGRPRLNDAMLARAEEIANAPLPALAPCGEDHLAKVLRTLLAVLPKRGSDNVSGALLIEAYEAKLGGYSREQISHLGDEAMNRCQWFPTIAECMEIIQGWQRNDDHVRLKQRASSAVLWEKQARFDEAIARLAAGDMDQAEIDALPVSWLSVAETRGYLWLGEDGGYTLRTAGSAPLAIAAPLERRAPTCRVCQGVKRVLTLEGDEVDCPSCREHAPC